MDQRSTTGQQGEHLSGQTGNRPFALNVVKWRASMTVSMTTYTMVVLTDASIEDTLLIYQWTTYVVPWSSMVTSHSLTRGYRLIQLVRVWEMSPSQAKEI